MQVELVSPERVLFSGEAEMVICRTAGGDIAFLNAHAPFVGALAAGDVRIRAGGRDVVARTEGGFVEVKDNRVIVLSDAAEVVEGAPAS